MLNIPKALTCFPGKFLKFLRQTPYPIPVIEVPFGGHEYRRIGMGKRRLKYRHTSSLLHEVFYFIYAASEPTNDTLHFRLCPYIMEREAYLTR